jgi:hypothetical protein
MDTLKASDERFTAAMKVLRLRHETVVEAGRKLNEVFEGVDGFEPLSEYPAKT